MRRLAILVPVIVTAVVALGAPAIAADGSPAASRPQVVKQHRADGGEHGHKGKKHGLTLSGMISDTPTVTIGAAPAVAGAAASSSATLTVTIRGGAGKLRGIKVAVVVDANTVIRRGGPGKTVADLKFGDHVSVRGRLLPSTVAGPVTIYAFRINASPRDDDESGDRPNRD